MTPILYEKDEIEFTSHGLGDLTEIYDVDIHEQRNGLLQLTASYPVSGISYDDISVGRVILAKPNQRDDNHAFRIVRTELDISGYAITIEADSITYDLTHNLVKHLNVNSSDGQTFMNSLQNAIVNPSIFTFYSDVSTVSTTKLDYINPMEAIMGTNGSFLQFWGGELKRENRRMAMFNRRGRDNVSTFRLGKNIAGLKYTVDIGSLVTRIIPTKTIQSDDQAITLEGTPVDSKYINSYEQIYTLIVDFTDDKIKTVADLNATAKNWFTASTNTGVDLPNITVDIDILSLQDSSDYQDKFKNLESVSLTDTVTVYVPEYGVNVTAIVNELHYDPIQERVTKLTVGTAKQSFADSSRTQLSDLQNKIIDVKNQADSAVVNANGKNTNYYGSIKPSFPQEGDLWYWINGDQSGIKQFVNGDWVSLVDSDTEVKIAASVDAAVAQAESMNAELNQTINNNINETMTTVNNSLAAIDSEAAAFKSEADSATNSVASSVSALMTTTSSLSTQGSNAVSTANQALATASSVAVSAASANSTANSNATKAVTSAGTAITNANTALSSAASALSTANASSLVASSVATDVTGLKASYTSLNSSAGVLSSQTASLAVSASSASAQFDKVSSSTGSLAADTASLKVSASSVAISISNVQSSAGVLSSQTSSLAVSASSFATSITSIASDNGSQATSISSLKQRADGFDLTVSKVNNLSVGGRNLIVRAGELDGQMIGFNGELAPFDKSAVTPAIITVTPGESLTMSGTVGSDYTFRYAFYDGAGETLMRAHSDLKPVITVIAPAEAATFRISYLKEAQVKLERGTIPTDWTPAPEDVDAVTDSLATDTASLKVSASSASVDIGKVSSSANSLATDTASLKLSASSAALSIGNVQSSASSLSTQTASLAVSASSASAQFTKVNSSAGSLAADTASLKVSTSSAALSISNLTSSAGSLSTKTASLAVSASSFATSITSIASDNGSQATALSSLVQRADGFDLTVSKVDNLAVGGRNYVLKSDVSTSSNITNFHTSIPVSGFSGKKIVISVQVDYDNITGFNNQSVFHRVMFEPSFIDKRTGQTINAVGTNISPKIGDSFHGRIYSLFDFSNTEIASVSSDANALGQGIYVQGLNSDTPIVVSKPMIEIGTQPTDYSPAPEDATTALAQVKVTADSISNFVRDSSGNISSDFQTALSRTSIITGSTLATSIQTQTSSQISSAITDNNGKIISLINQDSSGVQIAGKNITLDGNTTVTGDFYAKGGNFKNLNASEIKTGTINASLINVINLNANNITTGTLNANNVAIVGKNTSIDLSNGGITIATTNESGDIQHVALEKNYLRFEMKETTNVKTVGGIKPLKNLSNANLNGITLAIERYNNSTFSNAGGDEISISKSNKDGSYSAGFLWNTSGVGKNTGHHFYDRVYFEGNPLNVSGSKIYVDGAYQPLLFTWMSWSDLGDTKYPALGEDNGHTGIAFGSGTLYIYSPSGRKSWGQL